MISDKEINVLSDISMLHFSSDERKDVVSAIEKFCDHFELIDTESDYLYDDKCIMRDDLPTSGYDHENPDYYGEHIKISKVL